TSRPDCVNGRATYSTAAGGVRVHGKQRAGCIKPAAVGPSPGGSKQASRPAPLRDGPRRPESRRRSDAGTHRAPAAPPETAGGPGGGRGLEAAGWPGHRQNYVPGYVFRRAGSAQARAPSPPHMYTAVVILVSPAACVHLPCRRRSGRSPGRGPGRLQRDEGSQIRTDLPQEPNSFVGRERELTELVELLGVTRALTLCGPGGIGKTRLALRVLHTTADAFPDGGCFVDLGDLWQADLVVPQVASALGIGEEPGRPLLDTLADAVASRRLLLVLDNCEHLIDTCAAVGQRLLGASPGPTLIATSRAPPPRARARGGRGGGGRGGGVAGAAAARRAGRAGRRRGREPLRGAPAVRRPGRRVAARLRHRPGQRRSGRFAVPGAGWHAAGDRAG